MYSLSLKGRELRLFRRAILPWSHPGPPLEREGVALEASIPFALRRPASADFCGLFLR